MVQRLSLYGLVSDEEISMALTTLEAVSGMSSRPLKGHQEVWIPAHRFTPRPVAGQANQTEQYRLLVHQNAAEGSPVKIEVHEVPEAGRNIKVISQTVLASSVLPGGSDVASFLTDLGYQFKFSFDIAGYEFVLGGSLVVHVYRLYKDTGELIDDSAQWLVKAYVDVETVTDLQAVERGTQSLLGVQQELRSVVALKMPSRASFNARMPRVA